MARVDYSKWDHIEVSDDEDDTHPNIDTPSLFRWRHQARVERDAAWQNEQVDFKANYKAFLQKYSDFKQRLSEAQQKKSDDLPKLLEEQKKLEAENREWKEKEEDMKKKERLRPWNIDTICREGKSKTIINAATLKHEDAPSNESSEEASINRLQEFVKKHNKVIRKFGMFQKPIDSQNFLIENPFLVCDETANQLVLWCIDLAMEEKFELMDHVSHQCIVMQFMLELAKSLKCDPRACIRPFFAKFINPEPEYHKAFDDELRAFRERIRARAEVRIQEAMEKMEEEERAQRLGPGGLDPVEVFDSLPSALQECFEKKDVEMLKNVLLSMDPKDSEYHMKRCVDSGLWVDNVNKEQEEQEKPSEAEESAVPSEPSQGDTVESTVA